MEAMRNTFFQMTFPVLYSSILVELEGNKFHEVHCPGFTVKEVEVHEVETISQTSRGDTTIELKLE